MPVAGWRAGVEGRGSQGESSFPHTSVNASAKQTRGWGRLSVRQAGGGARFPRYTPSSRIAPLNSAANS